jgi:transposase
MSWRARCSWSASTVARGNRSWRRDAAVFVGPSSARAARTQALNQMRSLVCTAPEDLRDRLRDLTIVALVHACAGLRPGADVDVTAATKLALRTLARRVLELETEIDQLDATLRPLVTATAPALVAATASAPTPPAHC